MSVMVAASGGIDSVVLLYETLRDTNHDVIALRVPEDSYWEGASKEFFDRERAAFWAVCDWCAKNLRAFDAREGAVVKHNPDGRPYNPNGKLPIRPGRAATMGTYWAECRYGSVGYNAKSLGVDAVLWGLTTWNNRLSAEHHKIHIRAFERWAGLPFVAPWIDSLTIFGERRGRSKLNVLDAAPPELRDLSSFCTVQVPQGPWCPCKGCAVRRFYRLIYIPNAARKKEIEDRIFRLTHMGPYALKPTKASFNTNTIYKVISDIPGWARFLREGNAG